MDMTISKIVADWKREAGMKPWKETVAVHRSENTLFIVTKFPGFFIGYRGQLIDKYRLILKENGYDLEIKFVDIFCGDVREF